MTDGEPVEPYIIDRIVEDNTPRMLVSGFQMAAGVTLDNDGSRDEVYLTFVGTPPDVPPGVVALTPLAMGLGLARRLATQIEAVITAMENR